MFSNRNQRKLGHRIRGGLPGPLTLSGYQRYRPRPLAGSDPAVSATLRRGLTVLTGALNLFPDAIRRGLIAPVLAQSLRTGCLMKEWVESVQPPRAEVREAMPADPEDPAKDSPV